jgi:hypothetical protein
MKRAAKCKEQLKPLEEFLDENGGGFGVRFRAKRRRK